MSSKKVTIFHTTKIRHYRIIFIIEELAEDASEWTNKSEEPKICKKNS